MRRAFQSSADCSTGTRNSLRNTDNSVAIQTLVSQLNVTLFSMLLDQRNFVFSTFHCPFSNISFSVLRSSLLLPLSVGYR